MNIKTIKVGPLQTNCYILSIDNECLVIDPGDEIEKILYYIGNMKVMGIIITHYHDDHISALNDLLNKYKVFVYDYKLDEKEYLVGKFKFYLIHTKGHHETCISIYFKELKKMFVGDFIFKDSIGRYDLETGNYKEIIKSIKKIKTYPKDVIIYPGHGDITNLGYEIENNYYFKD